MSLRSQGKNVLDFFVDASQALRDGNVAPSFWSDISLPQSNTNLSLVA